MTAILYSFRRCPFAMQARWALLRQACWCVGRRSNSRRSPGLLKVPKGTVPVLVTEGGQVIDESLEVMRWALGQADPRGLLQTDDGSRDLIAENDGPFKHHLDRFKYTDRYPGERREHHRDAGIAILKRWSERISHQGWLSGPCLSFTDGAVWPFVRQWRIADPEDFNTQNDLTPLRNWLQS